MLLDPRTLGRPYLNGKRVEEIVKAHTTGRGNYTLGLKDQLVFPEIEYDKIDKLRGMEITIVTSAPNDDQARALLQMLGMPFSKKEA